VRVALLVLVAACFSPHPSPGAQCAVGGICPEGLVCAATNTCELTALDAAVEDAPIDTLRDGCVPTDELCGDGIDQDCDGVDPTCPDNDLPDGATDVTAGGTFHSDLRFAHADDKPMHGGCGTLQRDVFFKVILTKPEVVYFDTFGSDFATELRVYPGAACGDPTSSFACQSGACGTPSSQAASLLPTGTTCVVVAQQMTGETTGALKLHVVRGGRTGTALPNQTGTSTITNTTCSGTPQSTASCVATSNTADDLGYYALVCPSGANVDASSCGSPAAFDNNVYIQQAGGPELACADDSGATACPANPNNAVLTNVATKVGLAWVIIDGFGTGCGTFTLTVNVH
jgi:hypothetical protein